jgi:hypothetical protein
VWQGGRKDEGEADQWTLGRKNGAPTAGKSSALLTYGYDITESAPGGCMGLTGENSTTGLWKSKSGGRRKPGYGRTGNENGRRYGRRRTHE